MSIVGSDEPQSCSLDASETGESTNKMPVGRGEGRILPAMFQGKAPK